MDWRLNRLLDLDLLSLARFSGYGVDRGVDSVVEEFDGQQIQIVAILSKDELILLDSFGRVKNSAGLPMES